MANDIHLHLRCDLEAIKKIIAEGADSLFIEGVMRINAVPPWEFDMYGQKGETGQIRAELSRPPVCPMPCSITGPTEPTSKYSSE